MRGILVVCALLAVPATAQVVDMPARFTPVPQPAPAASGGSLRLLGGGAVEASRDADEDTAVERGWRAVLHYDARLGKTWGMVLGVTGARQRPGLELGASQTFKRIVAQEVLGYEQTLAAEDDAKERRLGLTLRLLGTHGALVGGVEVTGLGVRDEEQTQRAARAAVLVGLQLQ